MFHLTIAAALTLTQQTAPAPLQLVTADRSASYALLIDPVTQEAYIKSSNSEALDSFAGSLAISGDTLVVGATGEDSAANGIDGDQTDNSLFNPGAAYVFVRNGSTWTQTAYLKASSPEAGDGFGAAVAIAGDTIVVGAVGEDSAATGVNGDEADNSAATAGAAYVFVRNAATWSQQAYLKASNAGESDEFGVSVAISGDTIVIGAGREDSDATGVNGAQGDAWHFKSK